ncbi:hypothetical protein GCM10028777_34760 [Angustibacter speluncae]
MRTVRSLTTRRVARLRGDRGASTLEFVAYLPIALIFLLVVFQVCVFMWALNGLNEAARQGARAQSLGQDGCAAASRSLSGYLDVVRCSSSGGPGMYTPSSVEVTVKTPVPHFIRDWMPQGRDLELTRAAYLP